jgi:hypothetical protein
VGRPVPGIIEGAAAGDDGAAEAVVAQVELDLFVAALRHEGRYGMDDGMVPRRVHPCRHAYEGVLAYPDVEQPAGILPQEVIEKVEADIPEKENESFVRAREACRGVSELLSHRSSPRSVFNSAGFGRAGAMRTVVDRFGQPAPFYVVGDDARGCRGFFKRPRYRVVSWPSTEETSKPNARTSPQGCRWGRRCVTESGFVVERTVR